MATRTAPKLDARILNDPESLSRALGKIVEGDLRQRRHRLHILRLQKQLRGLVSVKVWRVYLRLEDASAARLGEATELVAKWAFKQGRRRR
jgi:hypothetical protein